MTDRPGPVNECQLKPFAQRERQDQRLHEVKTALGFIAAAEASADPALLTTPIRLAAPRESVEAALYALRAHDRAQSHAKFRLPLRLRPRVVAHTFMV